MRDHDHPIIFSGPMILALLDGRKTQTRRLATSPLRKAQPSDRLWVREAFSNTRGDDSMPTYYKADAPLTVAVSRKFQPSIHMPRWASRLTLTVTETRRQSLCDITAADACSEGWPVDENDPLTWFVNLWDRLHNNARWDSNPRVVALTFTVDRCHIDYVPYRGAACP